MRHICSTIFILFVIIIATNPYSCGVAQNAVNEPNEVTLATGSGDGTTVIVLSGKQIYTPEMTGGRT